MGLSSVTYPTSSHHTSSSCSWSPFELTQWVSKGMALFDCPTVPAHPHPSPGGGVTGPKVTGDESGAASQATTVPNSGANTPNNGSPSIGASAPPFNLMEVLQLLPRPDSPTPSVSSGRGRSPSPAPTLMGSSASFDPCRLASTLQAVMAEGGVSDDRLQSVLDRRKQMVRVLRDAHDTSTMKWVDMKALIQTGPDFTFLQQTPKRLDEVLHVLDTLQQVYTLQKSAVRVLSFDDPEARKLKRWDDMQALSTKLDMLNGYVAIQVLTEGASDTTSTASGVSDASSSRVALGRLDSLWYLFASYQQSDDAYRKIARQIAHQDKRLQVGDTAGGSALQYKLTTHADMRTWIRGQLFEDFHAAASSLNDPNKVMKGVAQMEGLTHAATAYHHFRTVTPDASATHLSPASIQRVYESASLSDQLCAAEWVLSYHAVACRENNRSLVRSPDLFEAIQAWVKSEVASDCQERLLDHVRLIMAIGLHDRHPLFVSGCVPDSTVEQTSESYLGAITTLTPDECRDAFGLRQARYPQRGLQYSALTPLTDTRSTSSESVSYINTHFLHRMRVFHFKLELHTKMDTQLKAIYDANQSQRESSGWWSRLSRWHSKTSPLLDTPEQLVADRRRTVEGVATVMLDVMSRSDIESWDSQRWGSYAKELLSKWQHVGMSNKEVKAIISLVRLMLSRLVTPTLEQHVSTALANARNALSVFPPVHEIRKALADGAYTAEQRQTLQLFYDQTQRFHKVLDTPFPEPEDLSKALSMLDEYVTTHKRCVQFLVSYPSKQKAKRVIPLEPSRLKDFQAHMMSLRDYSERLVQLKRHYPSQDLSLDHRFKAFLAIESEKSKRERLKNRLASWFFGVTRYRDQEKDVLRRWLSSACTSPLDSSGVLTPTPDGWARYRQLFRQAPQPVVSTVGDKSRPPAPVLKGSDGFAGGSKPHPGSGSAGASDAAIRLLRRMPTFVRRGSITPAGGSKPHPGSGSAGASDAAIRLLRRMPTFFRGGSTASAGGATVIPTEMIHEAFDSVSLDFQSERRTKIQGLVNVIQKVVLDLEYKPLSPKPQDDGWAWLGQLVSYLDGTSDGSAPPTTIAQPTSENPLTESEKKLLLFLIDSEHRLTQADLDRYWQDNQCDGLCPTLGQVRSWLDKCVTLAAECPTNHNPDNERNTPYQIQNEPRLKPILTPEYVFLSELKSKYDAVDEVVV